MTNSPASSTRRSLVARWRSLLADAGRAGRCLGGAPLPLRRARRRPRSPWTGHRGHARRRAGLSRRTRHRAGVLHGDGDRAGGWRAAEDRLHRRPDRQARATCWRRSIRARSRPRSTRRAPRAPRTTRSSRTRTRDLDRYTMLQPQNLASKQTVDTQQATVAQLEAQIKGDQAAIDNARTQLEYTTHHLADRGPHGHPPGRSRQHRARDRHQRHRRGDAGATDLGDFHLARGGLSQRSARRSWRGAGQRRRALSRDGSDASSTAARCADRQSDRSRRPARSALKATFPNKQQHALAGPVRQRARARAHASRNALTMPTAAVQRGPNGHVHLRRASRIRPSRRGR